METIHVAHSPDADDAFMHYAAVQGLVDTRGLRFEEVLADIETLNQAAREGRYEITAISIHAYAYVADCYALLSSGASMGDGYGPVVIAPRALSRSDLRGQPVATPGRWTSARLALQLWQPQAQCVDVPFDQVASAVRRGPVAAGVLIHEGQLTYRDEGLHLVVDLGAWWQEKTGLPLPLGGNAIRRDLPREVSRRVAAVLAKTLRDTDTCGRLEGGCFGVVLTDASGGGVGELAERLRHAIATAAAGGGAGPHPTVSIGYAQVEAAMASSGQWIAAAQAALQGARALGRNRSLAAPALGAYPP
ncbi:MAG: MqnA/MqnD/SBP family protein [Thermoanaerobaculum sp.]